MNFYDYFYKVYDFYNTELFGGLLPQVVFSVEQRKGVRGYFSPLKFTDSNENSYGIICFNPSFLYSGNEEKVFSTLVHEMCHLYMKINGEDVVKGYHSASWAKKMEKLGLLPTSTGKEGGKKTGFCMTHLIIEGGVFDRITRKLLENKDFLFPYVFNESLKEEGEVKVKKSVPGCRFRYHCNCSSFWGKKGMNVHCNLCKNDFLVEEGK